MGVYIGSSFGYLTLDSWVMAKIIQLATMDLCRKFLNHVNDPCGRQFDQTTQAARSAAANIAEGSSRSSTSKETQLRLFDVARGSLNEVLDDFLFFLLDKGQRAWPDENPDAIAIRATRLSTPKIGKSMMHDASDNILVQKEKFDKWLNNDNLIIQANTIIILCERVIKMLRSQMEAILKLFEEEGGFTENMTDTRLKARQKQEEENGAPRCRECGSIMIKYTAKKGINAGHQFWGCSNFRHTGCKYTLPVSDS